MLIKRVYEVDPLCCPHCGGEMKVVAFIEPPQGEVIENPGAGTAALWAVAAAPAARRSLCPRRRGRC